MNDETTSTDSVPAVVLVREKRTHQQWWTIGRAKAYLDYGSTGCVISFSLLGSIRSEELHQKLTDAGYPVEVYPWVLDGEAITVPADQALNVLQGAAQILAREWSTDGIRGRLP